MLFVRCNPEYQCCFAVDATLIKTVTLIVIDFNKAFVSLKELLKAWGADQRVKSLKISIQVSMIFIT